MYREQIKVLDCTIRDGGLMNNHRFDDRFVRAIFKAVSEAGIDYMEIGYKNSKKLFPETNTAPGNSAPMRTSGRSRKGSPPRPSSPLWWTWTAWT